MRPRLGRALIVLSSALAAFAPAAAQPFDFADFTWLNGNSRGADPLINTSITFNYMPRRAENRVTAVALKERI